MLYITVLWARRVLIFFPMFSDLTLNRNNTTTLTTQTENLSEQHLQIVDVILLIDVLYPLFCSYSWTSITISKKHQQITHISLNHHFIGTVCNSSMFRLLKADLQGVWYIRAVWFKKMNCQL